MIHKRESGNPLPPTTEVAGEDEPPEDGAERWPAARVPATRERKTELACSCCALVHAWMCGTRSSASVFYDKARTSERVRIYTATGPCGFGAIEVVQVGANFSTRWYPTLPQWESV